LGSKVLERRKAVAEKVQQNAVSQNGKQLEAALPLELAPQHENLEQKKHAVQVNAGGPHLDSGGARQRQKADAGCRNPEAAEAIPNRPASKKAAAKWQAFGGSCAAHGDAAAQWTFCAIYDFSVKKTAAGLIFWPFSCKLKDNHARVFFARQNPAKRATHGIKIAKNNGA